MVVRKRISCVTQMSCSCGTVMISTLSGFPGCRLSRKSGTLFFDEMIEIWTKPHVSGYFGTKQRVKRTFSYVSDSICVFKTPQTSQKHKIITVWMILYYRSRILIWFARAVILPFTESDVHKIVSTEQNLTDFRLKRWILAVFRLFG